MAGIIEPEVSLAAFFAEFFQRQRLAAAAGAVTPDGEEGGNSPFTTAFLTALDEPPADVRIILGKVRDEMRRSVPGSAPFVYSSLGGGEYVINPNSARPAPGSARSARTRWHLPSLNPAVTASAAFRFSA